MQLDLQHARTVPLLRTPREEFWSSSYKHATPNGVKPSEISEFSPSLYSPLNRRGILISLIGDA